LEKKNYNSDQKNQYIRQVVADFINVQHIRAEKNARDVYILL